ncbi:serine hydrolase [Cupriavidus sp. WKF15]|uniref:serine hydrolase domain-containing protein n=1 Tax=Cupriavidus sp. WKF15 TaxID=3032282 RepID=UPI0023E31C1E|nr:serine hydrolase domain-containing protein [Cupriavidus sp. WKF15]WER46591.1 serine hydrolase [Cupriavidus sp. WKF15]
MKEPALHLTTYPLDHADTPEEVGLSTRHLQAFSSLLNADVDRRKIPGAVVLVARSGRIAWFEAIGFEQADAPSRPMQRHSVFRIAALTRPVVGVAALTLLEEGRLALNDPVERYIPEFARLQVGVESVDGKTGESRLALEPVRRAMTVHDLFRHTSGLTYGQFGDSLVKRQYRENRLMDPGQTNAEMVAKLAAIPLQCQPGAVFEYGMSTDVLGRVIEIVSGMDLDRFVAERVTRPLRMHATDFRLVRQDGAGLALPFCDSGAPNPVFDYDESNPPRWHSGGAGLLSTAGDYARFCQMLLNGGVLDGVRLLSRKSVELMLSSHLPPTVDYGSRTRGLGLNAPLPELGQGHGLAVGVRTELGLCPVPGSVGDFYWGGALGTYFWADPKEQLVAILMLQANDPATRVGYRALLRNVVYGALED